MRKCANFLARNNQMISFKFRHFHQSAILLVVRGIFLISLSYRDIEDMMLKRGLKMVPSKLAYNKLKFPY